MKHLIETTNSSSLATVPYDRIVLDTTSNEIVCKGGGYEYVDLGLPSGLKWAKCNVGAEKETDYGYYFQWGDIVDKSNAECSWSTYKHCNGSNTTLTKYNTDSSYGAVDNKTTLDLEDDAARANMGGVWRMPTKAEFDELISNTTTGWIEDFNGSGVNCIKFTSKTNGNSIFFPASGYRIDSSLDFHGYGAYVWSSSLNPGPRSAYSISFESADVSYSADLRYYGFVVRGVFK